MSPGLLNEKYPRVGFTHPGQKNPTGVLIHQLVLAVFVGTRPEGLVVRHLNGNSRDNRLSNLAYGTAAQNAQDAIAHGVNANLNKTHCPHGHEYTVANTYVRPDGKRRKCRACNAARERNRKSHPTSLAIARS